MWSSSNAQAPRRRLGNSELEVSPIGFGCWPIAGVSTLGVNDTDSFATLQAALDAGINFFDTAYSYGYNGEADRILARLLKEHRHEIVVASKVGQYFNGHRERVVDGRPHVLIEHASQVLQRLGVTHVDVMYLHVPDPQVPLAESAGAIAEILRNGWARYAAVSNVDAAQLAEFHAVCPVVVTQPPFNMLQQRDFESLRPFCLDANIGVASYWALMKGLLAGKMTRDHQFDPRDKRLTYAVYQGQAWQRCQDLLDKLRLLASELDATVAQVVLAWTVAQPGITTALCGAKRPQQIQETARAMEVALDTDSLSQIDSWIAAAAIE